MLRVRFGSWGHVALLVCAMIVALPEVTRSEPRQWGPNGVPIRQGHHIEWQRASFRRPDGKVLVTWSDTREGNRDVYGQFITPEGEQSWVMTGRPLANYAFRQEDPEVISVPGGWIIAWIDFRTDSLGDVYCQMYNDSGVPQWAANNYTGVVVDSLYLAEVFEMSLRAAPDGQGGVIIAWEDKRADTGDIYAQRVLSNGTRAWPSPLVVCGATNQQSGITADADGQGNLLVAWNDSRDNTNTNIYAAKITPDGQLPWGANGRLVCGALGHQTGVKLCPDGQGGCYLAWADARNGATDDMYIQRLNGNGQPQWTSDGVALCTAPVIQRKVRVATSYNGSTPDGVITAWEDFRTNGQIQEVYAQKLNLQGQPQWAANGIRVCGDATPDTLNPGGSPRAEPRLTSDLAGGMLCAWEDKRNSGGGEDFDLYATRISPTGTFLWGGECGRVVAEGPDGQGAPLLRLDSGDGVFIFYEDRRFGSLSVRYQNLDLASGNLTLDPLGIEIIYGLDGHADQPQMADMGHGVAGIVWKDNRYVSRGYGLYYQIVDTTGRNPWKELNGDTLVPDNEGFARVVQEKHHVCPDGSEGFFVGYEDLRTGNRRIRVTRVNNAGQIACALAAVPIFADAQTTDQQEVYVAPDGQGGCYVAWSNMNQDYVLDAFITRVGPDCQPVWAEPVRLTTSDDDDFLYGMVSNPDGCAIVVWRSNWYGSFDISGAKVCSDGTVVWNHAVCDAVNVQDNPSIVPDYNGGAFVAWEDYRQPVQHFDVYAQHLDAQGGNLWTPNGVLVISDTLQQQRPALAPDSLGNLYVFWEDFRTGVNLDLFGQKLNAQGQRQWATGGRLISGGRGDQSKCVLHADWQNGVYGTWADARGADLDIYSTHIKADNNLADGYWEDGVGGLVNQLIMPQDYPAVSDDGHGGGVIATWVDARASGKEPLLNIWGNWVNDYTVSVRELPRAVVPTEPELGQNYPNPFNPTTRIEFSMPNTERVEIVVFNALGQQVATLVDRVMTAGKYELTFKADRLASGLYFYRLKTPTYVDVKKMTLLR